MVGAAIFQRLNGATTAEDRVFPSILPEAGDYPAITYRIISSVVPARAFTQDAPLRRVRVQVDCWGSTYAQARALAGEVEAKLNRFKGAAGGMEVQDAFLDTEGEAYESETQLRRVSQDYTFWIL